MRRFHGSSPHRDSHIAGHSFSFCEGSIGSSLVIIGWGKRRGKIRVSGQSGSRDLCPYRLRRGWTKGGSEKIKFLMLHGQIQNKWNRAHFLQEKSASPGASHERRTKEYLRMKSKKRRGRLMGVTSIVRRSFAKVRREKINMLTRMEVYKERRGTLP